MVTFADDLAMEKPEHKGVPPATGLVQGNVFAGARHLVTDAEGDTYFSHSDWLGTERVRMVYSNPNVPTKCTSLPFGDGFSCNGGDWSPLHFTGKVHDGVSGLDDFGARYLGSSLGRFMMPDPGNLGGELDESANPQSWNSYDYVRNNPLNLVDPDGLDCIYAGDFSNSGTVVIELGDHCSNGGGTYVSGTIDEKSLVYDQKSNQLSFNFSNAEDQTGGTGVVSLGPPRSEGISDSDRFDALHMGVGLGKQGVNWALRSTAANALGALGGYLLGRGIQAILAAREATAAAEAAVDVQNVSSKITRQMLSRGWTQQAVIDTIKEAQEAGTVYPAVNKATGGAATEYVSQSTGKFVVVDNSTKQIIQVSGPGFRPNYMAKP